MAGKRTRYSADFKAKVALEALRGELTTAQLAAKHGIHQTMVGEWKRQAMEGLTAVFSGKTAAQESAKAAEADGGRCTATGWPAPLLTGSRRRRRAGSCGSMPAGSMHSGRERMTVWWRSASIGAERRRRWR